jgi:putative NADH-flavin reductase
MAHIALLGAAGRIGAEIREEALRRGHRVTALVRGAGRIALADKLDEAVVDAYDAGSIARAVAEHDAFISAFSPDPAEPAEGKPERLRQAHAAILAGVRQAGVKRVILVGGVGSLWAQEGVLVVDSEEYGTANRGPTLANLEIFNGLKADGNDLDWTYVSPPRRIEAGERTGVFRLGEDHLLRDEQGVSRISRADFAIALLDALENNAFVQKRFTVAY